MIKYQTNNVRYRDEPYDQPFWNGATGGDVIKSVVNRPKDYWDDPHEHIGIEEKIDRLMEAVGKIADKTGINLLDVFSEDELHIQYKLRTEG
jgi:hypothetical protein